MQALLLMPANDEDLNSIGFSLYHKSEGETELYV